MCRTIISHAGFFRASERRGCLTQRGCRLGTLCRVATGSAERGPETDKPPDEETES